MRRRRFSDIGASPRDPEYEYADLQQVHDLTQPVIEEFCGMVAKGIPATAACDYIGITDTRFQAWRRKGELVRQGDTMAQGKIYLLFVLGLRKAGAKWVMERVKEAQDRNNRNWYRDLRLLQVRDRTNFAQDAQGGSEELRDANETFL